MKTERQQDQEVTERLRRENLERVDAGGCAPPVLMTTEAKVEAVARYHMAIRSGCLFIELEDDGQWVDYDDHQSALDALRGEVERLRAIESAARTYYREYCQDEAGDEPDDNGRGMWTGASAKQINDAAALRDALTKETP